LESSSVLPHSENTAFDSKLDGVNKVTATNKTRTYFTVLFLGYFGLTLFRFIFPANFFVTSLVISIGLTALLCSFFTIRKSHLSVYIYVTLLIFSHLISSLAVFRTERVGHVVLFILSNTGITMLLIKRYIYSWGASTVFYLLAVIFILLILTGFNPDENLTVVSHNGISMLIIIACITIYLVNFLIGKDIVLLPAVLTLIISIWASGRSGILSSFVLLLGLTLIRYKINLRLSFLIGGGICALIYYFLDSIIMNTIDMPFFTKAATLYLNKTSEGGPDVRVDIWQNYFNNLDFYRLIFGANVLTDPWPEGEVLAYNYHNTFINLHLQTGFMGIATIFLFIVSLTKFLLKNQIFFVLFLSLSIRWFTDIGLYFESWDYLPFFFTSMALVGKNFKFFSRNS
jgi:hypothetical protein